MMMMVFSIPHPTLYTTPRFCGFHDLVERLVINHPQLINTIDGRYEFPVLAALSGKYIQVAEFLLRHGGKFDIRGADGQTPLQMLIDWGRARFPDEDVVDLVSFLLKHGADVNFRGGDLSLPLCMTRRGGQNPR
jgi:ankyrin repeat protein